MNHFVKKIIKFSLSLVIIFSLVTSVFAVTVSDNDKEAFMSKTEFDSLQNNFQNQLNHYNSLLDSKIDQAIANYLAGVDVSISKEYNFPFGAGEKCLIFYSGRIDDLGWGKANLKFNIHQTGINTENNNAPLTYMSLSMTRTPNDYSYEVFNVNPSMNKFISYLPEAVLDVSTNTIAHGNGGGAAIRSVPSTSVLYYRWHGDPWDPCTLSRGAFTVGSYSDRLFDLGYMASYSSGVNTGIWQQTVVNYHLLEANWIPRNENVVKYVFENSDTNNSIWSLPLDIDDGKKQLVGKTVSPYAAATSTKPQSYNTPSAAGVSSSVYSYMAGDQASNSYRWTWTNLEWRTYGKFNDASNTTTTSRPWYEIQLENQNLNGNNLINSNIPNVIMSNYDTYLYTGRLGEGLPICEVEENCLVEFELDTTGLIDTVIAFDTAPFSIDSTPLENHAENSAFTLTVNGVKQDKSAAIITPMNNRIKLEFKNFTGKKAVFWKMGLPSTITDSTRVLIEIPKTYTVTKKQ